MVNPNNLGGKPKVYGGTNLGGKPKVYGGTNPGGKPRLSQLSLAMTSPSIPLLLEEEVPIEL